MKYLVAVLVAAALAWLAHVRTDGFGPDVCRESTSIVETTVFDSAWPKQFSYLGRGKQAFAFVSGDYVLKLFDTKHLNTPWYAQIPGLFSARKARSLQRQKIFPESYQLAFDFVREETGLLCVHMGTSANRLPSVELIDKASRHFTIDLNRVAFVLQKRGHGTLLGKLSEVKHNSEQLRLVLDEYLALHAKRIALSIADYDRDIRANYAWGDKGLLYIDPARFYSEPKLQNPARLKHEWWSCTYRLRKWLVKQVPEQVAWFDGEVEKRQKA